MFFHHGAIVPSKSTFNFHKHVLPICEGVIEVKCYLFPGLVLYTLRKLGCQTQLRMLLVLQEERAQARSPRWEHADTLCNIS